MFRLASIALFVCVPASVFAGEFNVVLNVGDEAPAFSDLPGVDGKAHSLADYKDSKLVVVVFTCNSCPVAQDYEDRIIEFAKAHPDDVAVVAINANRTPEDTLEKMKERAAEKKFPFAYIYDESGKVAKAYGATITPEFFVLSPDRKIVYMGGLDDESDASKVKQKYVELAVHAALKGEAPETKETYARGCKIRFARERRSAK